MSRRPPLTSHRRLAPGAVLRRGSAAAYRAVEITAGEPHLLRHDLCADTTARPSHACPLLCLAHLTDLQITDVQSPARFEYLNGWAGDPRYAKLVPSQRPQEALAAHAVNAMARTINAVRGPATRLPVALAVTTGDNIDNAQWNELQQYLALFGGGRVKPDSGGPCYEGVQAPDWPGDIFWRPDGGGANGPDLFRREYGFPHHPGLLQRALRPFTAEGLRMPWLTCHGNHEALNQGVGAQTAGLAAALTGGQKPLALPASFDHDRALALYTLQPEAFMAGPARAVTADRARRPITTRDFVEAHFRPGSRPPGHGFTHQNRADGTAYYAYDLPAIRIITLDTACPAGGSDGYLGRDQARWLETKLAEVHSVYRAAHGRTIRTGNDDRLVVILSHHGSATLRPRPAGPEGEPHPGGADIIALLHRFRNVVLWLNGHTHTNAVRARRDPNLPARGFWEVTTCSLMDWPCQARLVEFVDCGRWLSIVCTMVDHDSPPAPRSLRSRHGLAALHRELAANAPFAGAWLAGKATDRNVELRITPPFPAHHLP